MNRNGALAGMLVGAATVLAWIYVPITINGQTLSAIMYEIVPGFILSTLTIFIVSNITGGAEQSIKTQFEQMEGLV